MFHCFSRTLLKASFESSFRRFFILAFVVLARSNVIGSCYIISGLTKRYGHCRVNELWRRSFLSLLCSSNFFSAKANATFDWEMRKDNAYSSLLYTNAINHVQYSQTIYSLETRNLVTWWIICVNLARQSPMSVNNLVSTNVYFWNI